MHPSNTISIVIGWIASNSTCITEMSQNCFSAELKNGSITHGPGNLFIYLCIENLYFYLFRTQALDETSLLTSLPGQLRTEIAIHVHLDTLKKVLH